MKKTVSIVVLFALLLGTAWAGLGSDKAMYVGGTPTKLRKIVKEKFRQRTQLSSHSPLNKARSLFLSTM